MFQIGGKTGIASPFVDEGPAMGLLWLKWFIATAFLLRFRSSEEGGRLTPKSYFTGN